MKMFTVTHVYEEIDVTPWLHIFKSLEAAQKAIEQQAVEDFDSSIDPNAAGPRPVFPGLDWSDDGMIAWIDEDEPSHSTWLINECELKD